MFDMRRELISSSKTLNLFISHERLDPRHEGCCLPQDQSPIIEGSYLYLSMSTLVSLTQGPFVKVPYNLMFLVYKVPKVLRQAPDLIYVCGIRGVT